MPLPRQKPLRWAPAGLSDAVDGTESFAGAMSQLGNLVPDPGSSRTWLARPAAVPVAQLPDYAGGPVTDLGTVGDVAYGMYASTQFSGKDRPFAYDMATGAFLPISGMAPANLPASQPFSGDWTPPTSEQIGPRVVFTHPGFAGGVSNPPYYNSFFGNTTNGSPLIAGITPIVAPFLAVGMRLFNPGVPAGTTIASISSPIVSTIATGTAGTNTITVASAAGIAIGQTVSGGGVLFLPATRVTNIAGTTITLSANLTANLSATPVVFTGAIVTMSQNATATANRVAISVVSAASAKFGWLDVSSFAVEVTANTTVGSPVLTGNPDIIGVQPGMAVTGPNIPANSTVTQAIDVTATLPCNFSANSNQITLYAFSGEMAIADNMIVAGAGIPFGTMVVDVDASTSIVTIDQFTTAASTPTSTVTFSGAIITISANATANAAGSTVSIAGGTAEAPQWASGDTNVNPLAAVPVFVRPLSGRAWFGVNTTGPPTSGVTASDAGSPCQVTSVNQTLLFQDGIPVTAAAGMALLNQLGGIIQSLMVFQGAANIRQITGDFSTENIFVNSLETATGTHSPLSIAKTPKGLLFAAPDGLRLIDFSARVSEPLGIRGKGLALPFVNILEPSRASASYNANVYRLTLSWKPPDRLSTIWGPDQRTDEFWFHLDLGKWSGPHTSTLDQSAPWQAQNSFICAPTWSPGALYRSDAAPQLGAVYTENGKPLQWTFATVRLPDNPEQMAVLIVESSLFFSMRDDTQALISALDDAGNVLDQTYLWLGPGTAPAQRAIPWHEPFVFRQLLLAATGPSSGLSLLGALNLRYQILGYQLPEPSQQALVLGFGILGGGDVLGPGPGSPGGGGTVPGPPAPEGDLPVVYVYLGSRTSYTLGAGAVLGERIGVKDNLGQAGAFPKTIFGAIDGGTSIVLNQNFEALEFVWNGVGWSVF